MMRLLLSVLALLLTPAASAEVTAYPAANGDATARVLVVYSSLDKPLAEPMIAGFQKANPTIAVHYEEMLTGDIYARIVDETNAKKATADVAFSSAMDLQVKLANDGYAQEADLPLSARWPRWGNWRNTAYALTFEPAVFVYHKPSFKDRAPPATRGQFVDYLKARGDAVHGRIATYDIERSGVGFMFFSRDQEQFADIWSIVRAFGAAGIKLYSTSSAILERIADGRAVLGYNILGSYAADWARPTTRSWRRPAPGGGWDQTAPLHAGSAAQDEEGIAVPATCRWDQRPRRRRHHRPRAVRAGSQRRPDQLIVGGYVMVGAILTNKSPVTLDQVTPIARLTGEYEAIVVRLPPTSRTWPASSRS
jgi:hypothetical protein